MISNRPYAKSEALLERALRHIPLGTQTFSKSASQFPYGAAPLYIDPRAGQRASGMPTATNTSISSTPAGGHPRLQRSRRHRRRARASSTTASSSRCPIRSKSRWPNAFVELVPCAEMVRFGKNGSDATAGAIRVARAFTGRDHVAVCGYHGWQDWYIGSTARNLGVPAGTCATDPPFDYNDLDSLEALFARVSGEIAAVILEPMNVA